MQIEKIMYVIRKSNTNCFKRNNGYFRDVNEKCTSAIKLYESEALAKSAISAYRRMSFDIIPVFVSMNIQEDNCITVN